MIELNFNRKSNFWDFGMEFEKLKEFKTFHSNGYVDISVDDCNFDEPQIFQRNAINYFNDNQEKILNAFCRGIVECYPRLKEVYNIEEFDEQYGFSEFKNTIKIYRIEILGEEKDNFSYLGFVCSCTWNIDGLQITMHKDRVVGVYPHALNYPYEEIILKDKSTEEEWEDYIKSKEKQREEKLAKYYKEQKEFTKKNKKWWQFWK